MSAHILVPYVVVLPCAKIATLSIRNNKRETAQEGAVRNPPTLQLRDRPSLQRPSLQLRDRPLPRVHPYSFVIANRVHPVINHIIPTSRPSLQLRDRPHHAGPGAAEMLLHCRIQPLEQQQHVGRVQKKMQLPIACGGKREIMAQGKGARGTS